MASVHGRILFSALAALFLVSVAYAQAAGGDAPTHGTFTGTVNGPRIDINYVPCPDTNCGKIVLVQVVCRKVILKDDGWFPFMPSDATAAWTEKDASTVDGGKLCTVDYINNPVEPEKGEKDPYYNGDDPQDGGDRGASTGSGNAADTKNATINDKPRYADRNFDWLRRKYGDPVGKTIEKVTLEFEVCAFCAEGRDRGANYGCYRWDYNQNPGQEGAASDAGGSGGASGKFNEALDAWSAAHGFNLPRPG